MNHQFIEELHDEYTATGIARISRRIPQLQQELLRVPEWAQAFLDLSARMQEQAGISMHVLRYLDLRAAGRLGSTRDTRKITETWTGATQRVEDTANLVEKFCISAWELPEHGLEPAVTTRRSTHPETPQDAASSSTSPAQQAVQPTLDQDT
jgi:hypothetical protein